MNTDTSMLNTLRKAMQHLHKTQNDLTQRINTIESTLNALQSNLNSNQTQQQPQHSPNKGDTQTPCSSIFLPELDYLLWITRLRDEFRVRKNGLYIKSPTNEFPPNSSLSSALKIVYGYADYTDIPTPSITHTLLRPPIAQTLNSGTGILTCLPSPTLFSLGLGSD